MMRVLKPLQDKATTGAGKSLVLPEPRRVRFLFSAIPQIQLEPRVD
jgi:hypothetical protein